MECPPLHQQHLHPAGPWQGGLQASADAERVIGAPPGPSGGRQGLGAQTTSTAIFQEPALSSGGRSLPALLATRLAPCFLPTRAGWSTHIRSVLVSL